MPVSRSNNNTNAPVDRPSSASTNRPKSSFNDRFHATFSGRLGADPEVKVSKTGMTICNFSVGCSRGEDTEWRRCTAFRQLGQYIGETFRKGEKVLVSCSDQKSRQYSNDEGHPMTSIEWTVDGVSPLFYGKGNEQSSPHTATAGIGDPDSPLE